MNSEENRGIWGILIHYPLTTLQSCLMQPSERFWTSVVVPSIPAVSVLSPPHPPILQGGLGSLPPLEAGCLTWAGCTGGSCGNRRRLPSGAASIRACATRPSWTCKGARSGGGIMCHGSRFCPWSDSHFQPRVKMPICAQSKFRTIHRAEGTP